MFYELGNQANIQCLLSQVDPLVLTNKIADFRKLNISRMDSVEIDEAISNVLCWNGVFSCYTNIKCYPAGTRFFRVKRLKGANIPNERFCTYSDFWETNAKYLTTYGRLNKPGESLLYHFQSFSVSAPEPLAWRPLCAHHTAYAHVHPERWAFFLRGSWRRPCTTFHHRGKSAR